jgi:hypothetical protein
MIPRSFLSLGTLWCWLLMSQQAFEGSVSSPIGLLCLWNIFFFQAAISGSVKHRVVGSRIYDSFVECCRRDFQVFFLMNIIIVNNSVQTLMWCEYVNADIECCSEFVFCTESHLLAVKSSLAVQCKITLVGCNKGLEELRACCQLFEVVPRLKSVNL